MTIADTATPVLVLDSPYHGGLGVTRSLGRLGIPVYNVDSNRLAPAFFSRYCRGKFVWDLNAAPPAANGPKWILEDCDLAASFGYRGDGKLKFSEWLRSFRGVRESGFFALDDPLPVLPMISADLGTVQRRLRPPQAAPPFDLVPNNKAVTSASEEDFTARSPNAAA